MFYRQLIKCGCIICYESEDARAIILEVLSLYHQMRYALNDLVLVRMTCVDTFRIRFVQVACEALLLLLRVVVT